MTRAWLAMLFMGWAAIAPAQERTTVSDRLTLAEAQAMPPQALATRVLGLSGASMREARVVAGSPPFGSPRVLASIDFAATPEATGVPDVCSVDHVEVDFLADRVGDDDPPVRARTPRSDEWWSMLPAQARMMTLAARQAACRAAGPVLGAVGKPHFFHASIGNGGRLDLDALLLLDDAIHALATPAAIRPPVLDCGDGGPSCDALRTIDAGRPTFAHIDRCANEPAKVCLELRYDERLLGETGGSYCRVLVEVDPIDIAARRFRPLLVRVGRVTWVA